MLLTIVRCPWFIAKLENRTWKIETRSSKFASSEFPVPNPETRIPKPESRNPSLRFHVHELKIVQALVDSAPVHEILVRANFRDRAPIEDHNAVGAADRRQPVRNHHDRPSHYQVAQGPLDEQLGLRVEFGGRFVQDEQRRILEQGPGDGDALALAAREALAALADHRGVTLRHLADEIVGQGGARRLLNFDLVERFVAVADVIEYRVVEKNGFLGHHADLRPKRTGLHFADVITIDQDPPGRHVEEPGNQVGQAGLAGAARAYDRHHLALSDPQVHIAQQRQARLIIERDPFEDDFLPKWRQRDRARSILDFGTDVEVAENLFRGAHRLLKGVVNSRQSLDGLVHFDERIDKSHKAAGGLRLVENLIARV